MPNVVIDRRDFQQLLVALAGRGFQVIGPTVRDGAIVSDEVRTPDDLPAGWTDEQDGGTYRLKRRHDAALFGYAVGPQAWKRFLHPPTLRLWQAAREGRGFRVSEPQEPPPAYAFLGVRACELRAIAIQDQVFLKGPYVDPAYQARREPVFLIAVNCSQAGGTCFCVSMGTGPGASTGFDLALTERLEGSRHEFLVEIGTRRGDEVMREVPHRAADAQDLEAAARTVARTAAQMGRTMNTASVKELLAGKAEHPRWEQVASRCLTCANCTMVCPTCFCTTVHDVTDLTGDHAERWRTWDSCFTADFSFLHGGSVRASAKSRYRQWLTHKLSTWIDQFGTSGCVGCGRCITWCPVGIDLTEEVRAIRESSSSSAASPPAQEPAHGNPDA